MITVTVYVLDNQIFTLLKLPEARTDVLKANRKNETPLAAAIKHNHVKIGKYDSDSELPWY